MAGQHTRRWLQFSLRSLLVLVTVLAVWLGREVNRARRQNEAVAAIQQAGGMVFYDSQVRPPQSRFRRWFPRFVRLLGEDLADAVVIVMLFPEAEPELLHDGTNERPLVSLAMMIGRLEDLVELDAGGMNFDDADLAHLRGLKKLASLYLSHVQLNGTVVHCTRITDDGLAQIAHLSRLEALHLEGAGITDAGLAHLHSLSKLECLDLTNTMVTEAGVAAFRHAVPACRIDLDTK